jgi:hypothetical protein
MRKASTLLRVISAVAGAATRSRLRQVGRSLRISRDYRSSFQSGRTCPRCVDPLATAILSTRINEPEGISGYRSGSGQSIEVV